MYKILIIDDEEDFCHFVKLNLEKDREYEVLTSNRGKKGIEIAKKENPNLILLDILMPDMEGSEVAENLLEDDETKQIPIIFLTAMAQKEEVRSEGGMIGGREFIAKPVTPDELKNRIKSVLKNK